MRNRNRGCAIVERDLERGEASIPIDHNLERDEKQNSKHICLVFLGLIIWLGSHQSNCPDTFVRPLNNISSPAPARCDYLRNLTKRQIVARPEIDNIFQVAFHCVSEARNAFLIQQCCEEYMDFSLPLPCNR